MPLTLYTTLGCHLCEQAEAMLQDLGVVYDAVEIADSEALVERYGVRIPVLHVPGKDLELGWPFDRRQLSIWLDAAQNS